jgi:ubiquinone/menaquinone biosynthesis C-methylase UbiE
VKPSVSFDRIADRYDETRGGFTVGRSFADAVEANIAAPPTRFVELGVGTGLVALPLTERGYDVLGIDLSPKMIAIARERIGARVAVADARRVPIATASADALVAARVLHVVGDPGATLVEAARIVRPGGRVVAIMAGSDQEEPSDDIGEATRAMHGQRLSRVDLDMVISLADATGALALVTSGLTGSLAFDETPR